MTSNASLLSTEVPGLDTVLGGGLSRGALIFLVGTSGAGKTVLGSQILFNAAQRGVSTLILTAFSESHVKLLEHLEPFAFFDRELVGSSVTLLSMQTLVGEEADPVAMIIRTIRETGARLVMLDGFQGLDALLRDRNAVHRLVASLASQLPYLDVTLVVTLEGAAHDPAVALELTAADFVIEM